jgi:hypothetical protein
VTSGAVLVHADSAGHRICDAGPRLGHVMSRHDGAVNLVVGRRVWTVLPCQGLGGPRRVTLSSLASLGGLPVDAGDRVAWRGGRLAMGRCVVDTRMARTWRPPVPPRRHPDPAALMALASEASGRCWPGTRQALDVLLAALRGGRQAGVDAAAARLVGLGPGLTPSGDDVLVGLVAGLRSVGGPPPPPQIHQLAVAVRTTWSDTTELSRGLLHDALDGDVPDPLATLLAELAAGGDTGPALRAVLATGATSGADTCLGLAAAGELATLHLERRPA